LFGYENGKRGVFVEIQVMKSVLAVSRYRSLQEAANSLSMSVSSVSKHIAAAEAELRTELFTRGTKSKSVMLTDAGVQLIPMIEDILHKHHVLERTAERIYNEKTMYLHIAYNSLIGTMGEDSIISDYCMKYPNINVEQRIASAPEMFRMLRGGILDGCFVMAEVEKGQKLTDHYMMKDLLEQGQFGYISFYKTNCMRIALPSTHPLAGREQVTLNELQEETFIFNLSNRANVMSKHGEKVFQKHEPPLKMRYMDFTRRGIVLEIVASGGGVVPTICKDSDVYPGVSWVKLADWDCTIHGVFLYRRDVRSRAMLNFRKCVEEMAKSTQKET